MTKENKIQEVKQVIAKVAEKKVEKNFERGDALVWKNVTYKVVEVLEPNRWHIKNVDAPFNSMIITDADLEVQSSEHDPDLLYRKDDRFSL